MLGEVVYFYSLNQSFTLSVKRLLKAILIGVLFAISYPVLCVAEQDTNYYRKYNDRLIIALYQSKRQYKIDYTQKLMPDTFGKSKINYLANANDISGIEIDYDKISLSLGYKSTPPDGQSRQGKTTYSSLNFSVGGNKWFLETSYKNYKGFYDNNTAAYDTSFSKTKPYYQNHSMTTKGLKVKGFYFFNDHKFSYKSSYTCTYRQLKSAYSIFALGNLYYNRFSSDTAFIPPLVWGFYPGYYDMNKFNVLALSGGMGASGNLILFKRLFLNATFGLGMEIQNRHYHYFFSGRDAKRIYISVVNDSRVALGYNAKNFFISLSIVNDLMTFNDKTFKMSSTFTSGAFTIGYRFKVKENPIVTKVKQNKFYKML